MLVQDKNLTDEIISFKLVNGDEIVAKVVTEDDKGFVINRPCTVMPSNQGIGLMQSLITSELNDNITLTKSHVMMYSHTVKDMKNHYIHTTTGIQPAGGEIIT